LRTRYYQRAFRAITTGHSNRRRTQVGDFEALEICFPPDKEKQKRLIENIRGARIAQRTAAATLRDEAIAFSDEVGRNGSSSEPSDGQDFYIK
jgi:type I restriction enzyme M protein